MACSLLEKAITLLQQTGCTCVLCNEELIITDKRRGIRPLLDLLDNETNVEGFYAADKVVGKAAAYLYCLLKVKRLYALVISAPALEILNQAGIETEYGQLVSAIQNRTKDGFCPMEQAVLNIQDPSDALVAIRNTLASLTK